MDPSIRELERLASQGDRTAAAGVLAARVRTGTVSLAGLELAAYLGDEAARTVLGPSVLSRGPRFGGWAAGELTEEELAWSDLNMWILGLERWGVPVLVRALVALSRVAADELLKTYSSLTSVHGALDATLAWCDAPGGDTAGALSAAQEDAATRWLALDPLYFDAQGMPTRVSLLNQEALEAAEVASMAAGRDGHRFTQGARDPRAKVRAPTSLLSVAAVEGLVRDTLLPTVFNSRALGTSLAWGRGREPLAGEDDSAGVRASSVRSERLELAAYLGHGPSRRLLGPSVLCRWPSQAGWRRAGTLSEDELVGSHLTAWVWGLELWGVPWMVRGLCALGQAAATRFEQVRGDEQGLRPVIAAAEAWCAAPSFDSAVAVQRARESCEDRIDELVRGEPPGEVRGTLASMKNAVMTLVEILVVANSGQCRRLQLPSVHREDPRRTRSVGYMVYSLRREGVDVVAVVRDALLPLVLAPEPA